MERLREKERDIRDLKGIKICCIGPATARQIENRGMKVDLVPDYFISEGILKSFAGIDLRKKKILIPRAYSARDVLPAGLKKLGAKVDVVTAYETVNSGRKKEEIVKLFDENRVDVITFTSSSTVNNFVEIMGNDFSYPPKIKIACIGPVTAAAAKKAGFSVDIHQEEYTINGLVQALIDYFGKKKIRGNPARRKR